MEKTEKARNMVRKNKKKARVKGIKKFPLQRLFATPLPSILFSTPSLKTEKSLSNKGTFRKVLRSACFLLFYLLQHTEQRLAVMVHLGVYVYLEIQFKYTNINNTSSLYTFMYKFTECIQRYCIFVGTNVLRSLFNSLIF